MKPLANMPFNDDLKAEWCITNQKLKPIGLLQIARVTVRGCNYKISINIWTRCKKANFEIL